MVFSHGYHGTETLRHSAQSAMNICHKQRQHMDQQGEQGIAG